MSFEPDLVPASKSIGSLLLTMLCFVVLVNATPQEMDPDSSHTVIPAADADVAEPEKETSWRFPRGMREIGYEFGFAPTQPTFFGKKEYDTSGRKLTLASVRFGRILGSRRGVTYQYFFEVIPVSFSLRNQVLNGSNEIIRKNTYGFGVQPVGFRFLFRPEKSVKPFIQASAGAFFSSDPIPIPQGTRINFSGDLGLGFMYRLSESRSFSIGYRYFHVSNMHLSEANPGYNANIFYFGYSFFKK